MTIEFECTLSDGREVSVVAECEVEQFCDCYCSDTVHPHVIDYEFPSVIDVVTGVEAQLNDKDRSLLESHADVQVYAELRGANSDDDAA